MKDLLYEKYFKLISTSNNITLEEIINIIINSKELRDATLLSLYAKEENINTFSLSGLYYLNNENRSFTGTLTIQDDIILLLNITKDNTTKELAELFKYEDNKVVRYSSYQGGYSTLEVIDNFKSRWL